MGPTDEAVLGQLMSDFKDVAAGDEFLRLIELTPEVWRKRPHHFHLWLARKLAGLTQKELARRAGVNQSLVARVERGRDVRLTTMKKLYEALGYRMLILPLKAREGSMPWPAYSPVPKR
jgi:DNA-binding XRE family transcriptional regulator